MRDNLNRILSAATIVVALSFSGWLSGCSLHDEPKSASDLGKSTPAFDTPPANTNPLPAPEALADVLCRLGDPAVRGADKLSLVEDTVPADTATIDRFAMALRDNGFAPLACTATDIDWSVRDPGNVMATINITATDSAKPGGFTFPMEFHPYQGGWQLSRQTADMVLAFGNARSETSDSNANPAPEAPSMGPPASPVPAEPSPGLSSTPAPPR